MRLSENHACPEDREVELRSTSTERWYSTGHDFTRSTALSTMRPRSVGAMRRVGASPLVLAPFVFRPRAICPFLAQPPHRAVFALGSRYPRGFLWNSLRTADPPNDFGRSIQVSSPRERRASSSARSVASISLVSCARRARPAAMSSMLASKDSSSAPLNSSRSSDSR